MKDVQTILNEYEQGDMTQRVFMFLEYRSLREEFGVIDQKEYQADRECPDHDEDTEATPLFRRVLAFFRSCGPEGCCAPKGASN